MILLSMTGISLLTMLLKKSELRTQNSELRSLFNIKYEELAI